LLNLLGGAEREKAGKASSMFSINYWVRRNTNHTHWSCFNEDHSSP
jgi:hypothetical protein